jgi:hypothetical protein
MPSRKPQIIPLLVSLALVWGATAFLRGEDPAGEEGVIRMAGQVGIAAELLELVGKHMVKDSAASEKGTGPGKRGGRLIDTEKNRLAFMRNTDCCSAVAAWGLSAKELHGAVMCPDAARDFLAANTEFVSAGPVMFNSDVFMAREPSGRAGGKAGRDAAGSGAGGCAAARVGVSHKRAHQAVMARTVYGPDARVFAMQPVGLPYALKKGEVDAVILDLGVAAGLGQGFNAWKGDPVATQVLVLRASFAGSEAYGRFVRAYASARLELLEKYAGTGLVLTDLAEAGRDSPDIRTSKNGISL